MASIKIEITGQTGPAVQSLNEVSQATEQLGESQKKVAKTEEEKWKEAVDRGIKRKKFVDEYKQQLIAQGVEGAKASNKLIEAIDKQKAKWTELNSQLDLVGKAKAAFDWIKDSVQSMESLQTQFTALSLFDESGKYRKVLGESLVLTRGVANEYDLIGKTNQLVQQGFDLTEEQFRDLIDVSARYASVIGVDINTAIDKLSNSSLKEREGMMRKMGIQLDVNKSLKDYAKELGTSVEGLSKAERQTATLNAQVKALKDSFGAKGIDNAALMSPISTAMKQMDTVTKMASDRIIAQLGEIATAPVTRLLIKVMGGDVEKQQLADLERQERLNSKIVEKYGEGLTDKQKSLLIEKDILINEQRKRNEIQAQKEQMEKGLIAQQQGDLISSKTGGNIRYIKDKLKETRQNDDLYQTFKKANMSTDVMAQHVRMMKIDMELMLESSKKITSGIELAFKPAKDSEEARAEAARIAKERAEREAEAKKEAAKIAKEAKSKRIAEEMAEWKANNQIKMDSENYWTEYQIKQVEKVTKAKHDANVKAVEYEKAKVEYDIKSKEYMEWLKKGEAQLERDLADEKLQTLKDFNDDRLIKMDISKEEMKDISNAELKELIKNEKEYYDTANRMAEMGLNASAEFSSMLINDVLLGEKEFRKEMIGDFVKGIGTQMVADGTFHIFSGIAKGWAGDPKGWAESKAGVVEVGVGVGLGATAKAIGTSGGSESKSKETASADRINSNTNGRDQMQVYLYPSQKYYLRTHNNANKKLGYKK